MAARRVGKNIRKTGPSSKTPRKYRSVVASAGEGAAYAFESASLKQIVKYTAATLSTLLHQAIPTDLKKVIKTALEFARGEDDLVQDIVQTKVDFYASGLSISVKPPNPTNKGKLGDRFKDLVTDHQLHQVAEELIFNFCVTDNAILQWKVGDGVEYVTSLDPDMVEYSNVAGFETLKVVLPQDVIRKIQGQLGTIDGLKELRRNFPQKYIDAVKNGENTVELKNNDGEFWIVRTRNRRFGGLATPTLKSRFTDILMRQLLIAGDWAVAFLFKRAIEHIKAGEKSTSTLRSDPRELYPTVDDINALKEEFKKVGQSMRMYTNHTVAIEYPHPPVEIFSGVKYEKVEERILRWGGVIDTLMTGKGEGFSQGHLGARRFISHGHKVRETVGNMLAGFVLHEKTRAALGIPQGSTAQVSWNEQNLKEPAQILDELQALYDRALLDPETFHEKLGLKHDQIKERMKRYHEEKEIWRLDWEPNQGLTGENPGAGRPEDKNKPKAAPKSRPKPGKAQA